MIWAVSLSTYDLITLDLSTFRLFYLTRASIWSFPFIRKTKIPFQKKVLYLYSPRKMLYYNRFRRKPAITKFE